MKHQKKLQWICLCLSALLLLTGCSTAEPFSVTCMADEADLSMAWDVIVEPEEPPYNLGGWMYDNAVLFEVELPQDDVYTITLEYSRPGQVGTAEGEIYLTQPDADDYSSLVLEFPGTSQEALDWSIYTTLSFEAELPAGVNQLIIEPVNIPPRSDHFINLRQVTFTGTKPAPEDTQTGETEQEPAPTTQSPTKPVSASAEGFEGWWVLSPNYYEGVIPIISTFYVDEKNGTWTPYNELGGEGDTLPCSFPDENTIYLDMDVLAGQEMYLKDDVLYYVDDDHEAYVRAEDPGFIQVPSFAGTWIPADQDASRGSYELTDSRVSRMRNGSADFTVPYEPSLQTITIGSVTLDDKILYLDVEWPEPDLYPTLDGNVLIEKDDFRNNVFIRRDAPVTEQYAMMLSTLVNSELCMHEDTDSYQRLMLNPDFTFAVITMVLQDEFYIQDPDCITAGTWNLDENLQMHVKYQEGAEEIVDLNHWNNTLRLDSLNIEFTAEES